MQPQAWFAAATCSDGKAAFQNTDNKRLSDAWILEIEKSKCDKRVIISTCTAFLLILLPDNSDVNLL